MENNLDIITIDGPSGVGKSTVSRKVADITGFTYLDTGAMYRAAGWYLLQQGVSLDDEEAIGKKLGKLQLELYPAEDIKSDVRVVVNGQEVTEAIRTPDMAMVASRISAMKVVREILTEIQRDYGSRGNIVAEGRDTGTVVFPKARFKFFLDAQPIERATRRVEQLQARGMKADYQEILVMILRRDKNDSERALAPLKQAEDAVRIDTTSMAVDEVIAAIVGIVKERKN